MHHLKIKMSKRIKKCVYLTRWNKGWVCLWVEWQRWLNPPKPLGHHRVTVAELIVFAFSDNLSAENSKLSADSGIQRIQLLECMLENTLIERPRHLWPLRLLIRAMRRYDLTNKKTMKKTKTMTIEEHPRRAILETCDPWDTDYIFGNWEQQS